MQNSVFAVTGAVTWVAAGVGWLVFLIPAVGPHGKFLIFPLGFVAEFELMLWLVIKGVDEQRWAAG